MGNQKILEDNKIGKVKCWEVFKCKKTECPAYMSKNLWCWLISGTCCRDEIQGEFLEKMEKCLECEIFKMNMDITAMKETAGIVYEQFKEFRRMVDEKNKAKEKLQKKLIEYEKLSALGRLTANVAHEIRNPITVIGGLTERLKKSVSPGTKEEEYLELISLEAKKLEEILRDVLIFTNKPFFQREEQDINKIVDKSLDLYEDACKSCSISVYKILGDVPQIYVDKRQVKEAINNLISNAIDAMPDGGTLTIATNVDSLKGKNFVTVKVTDTGVGISKENLLVIYEPFFTTKIAKKEIGLGLSITRKIVEGHGGFIKVDSSVGKGSTFSLFFPYRAK